jgi:signal transduction histidine kinase
MSNQACPGSEVLQILVVDDRPENIASLRQVLARDDLQIVAALSGDEALGLMLDHDFALVLLDVQMPGMDGFEVADLMRRHERTRTVPIIFVTAISTERRQLFSGYEAGAVDYLFKPLDPFVIRAKVAAFLEFKRAQLAREQLVVELNRANACLQEISNLKSDYLSAASHELRTPLTVIKEYCSLVHDEIVGPLNAEQRRCLASALRNCNRLADLVNDLLDLDSIESGHSCLWREQVDLLDLLRVCTQDLGVQCRGVGQSLVFVRGDGLAGLAEHDPLPVLAAPDKIMQVVVNLVGNAHKFTPVDGTITVWVDVQGTEVVVEVQDNGPGIAVADQTRVFEKFAQLGRTDGPGPKGTGLGLPISRKIIELHGGRLDLFSAPGAGCRFRFAVPLYSDEGHLRAFVADGTRSPSGAAGSWTLLLLDTGPVPCAGLEDDLRPLVRTGEDRAGQVVVDGQVMHAVLLRAGAAGARALLVRLRALLAAKYPVAGSLAFALLDVSPGQEARALANPAGIAFTQLPLVGQPDLLTETQCPSDPEGALHV